MVTMSPPPIRDVETTQYIQTRAVVGDQIEPLVTRCKVRTASAFTPPHSATPRFLEARPKTLIAFIPLDGRGAPDSIELATLDRHGLLDTCSTSLGRRTRWGAALTSSSHGDVPAQLAHSGPEGGGIQGLLKRDKSSRRSGSVEHATPHPALGGSDEVTAATADTDSTLLLLF